MDRPGFLPLLDGLAALLGHAGAKLGQLAAELLQLAALAVVAVGHGARQRAQDERVPSWNRAAPPALWRVRQTALVTRLPGEATSVDTP
jgi:hypothetical protein